MLNEGMHQRGLHNSMSNRTRQEAGASAPRSSAPVSSSVASGTGRSRTDTMENLDPTISTYI